MRYSLKLNDECDAEKFLMRGTEIVGITSFECHLVWKCEPDLRNHGNCMLFRVVAQLAANMENSLTSYSSPPRVSTVGLWRLKGNSTEALNVALSLPKSFERISRGSMPMI